MVEGPKRDAFRVWLDMQQEGLLQSAGEPGARNKFLGWNKVIKFIGERRNG